MAAITIFSGLTKIGAIQLGEAQDYVEIARLFKKNRHRVRLVTSDGAKVAGIKTEAYQPERISRIVADSDIVFCGSYAPTEPIMEAWRTGKRVILKLYEPAPVVSLEFRDFKTKRENLTLTEYCAAALRLHLAVADYILYPSENAKYYYLGVMTSSGRLNPWLYHEDSNYDNLMLHFHHGILKNFPKPKEPYYRERLKGVYEDDFILLWNGGIWNWYDPETLIRAVALSVRKEPRVKLVFQGYKHPDMPPTLTAKRAITLAKRLKVMDKHVFFVSEWTSQYDRVDYLADSDLGVIFSNQILDAKFGVRNRILDHIWAGHSVMITNNDCFAAETEKFGLGYTIEPGDYRGAAKIIVSLARKRTGSSRIRANLRKYRREHSYEKLLKPLLLYCNQGEPALDKKYLDPERIRKLYKDFSYWEARLNDMRKKYSD